ncbi:AMME syndrome candidate 1 protein-like [Histomonas meleagridis]|uniref:AMME syndrome candidate 1 protein-like n=1 Tax=Histomonas meleagridis TaxID=135588 RepID=UPI003559BA2E|nr:AMME syndrome candidate 1 protein-like [Histomonas meleagridis]KAH0804374.1 AMME syndrome candidate 1 protein-like [Histomonas meleagridis]
MEATKELCYLCCEALENKVKRINNNKILNLMDPNEARQCPMFVTWKKANGNLRGCIGCFNNLPLINGLREYAVIAGTKDPRFSPITESELSGLKCGISLLHSFEKVDNVLDWEVGVHGIRLFIDGGYQATFLPEVAKEQNWTKEETLKELALKAGYYGKFDQQAMKKAKIERYQSSKCSAKWSEYEEFVKSLGSQ